MQNEKDCGSFSEFMAPGLCLAEVYCRLDLLPLARTITFFTRLIHGSNSRYHQFRSQSRIPRQTFCNFTCTGQAGPKLFGLPESCLLHLGFPANDFETLITTLGPDCLGASEF